MTRCDSSTENWKHVSNISGQPHLRRFDSILNSFSYLRLLKMIDEASEKIDLFSLLSSKMSLISSTGKREYSTCSGRFVSHSFGMYERFLWFFSYRFMFQSLGRRQSWAFTVYRKRVPFLILNVDTSHRSHISIVQLLHSFGGCNLFNPDDGGNGNCSDGRHHVITSWSFLLRTTGRVFVSRPVDSSYPFTYPFLHNTFDHPPFLRVEIIILFCFPP